MAKCCFLSSAEAIFSSRPVDRPAKRTPLRYWVRLVPVANRRAPRASRSALTSDGAAPRGRCLFAHRGKPGWYSVAVFEQAASSRGHGSFRGLLLSEPQPGVGEADTPMSRARSTRSGVSQRKTRGCRASSRRDAPPPQGRRISVSSWPRMVLRRRSAV